MINDLAKTWGIFTPAERRRSVLMMVLVILMAGAEMLGVLSLMPFLSILGRPEIIQQNAYLKAAYDALGFQSPRSFVVAVGTASIVLVVGSSIFKAVTLHLVNRFVHFLRHSISVRLMARYLHQPYEFFLIHNPAVLSRNVLSEVDQLLDNLIRPLAQLVAQGAIVLAMAVLIFVYDPVTALGIVTVLALLYGGIYALVRKRLRHVGTARQEANGRRYQACNEALGGIKDIKITHASRAYQESFKAASRELSRHRATAETLAQSPLYLVEATGFSMLIVLALLLLSRSQDMAQVLPALGLYGFAAYRMLPAAQIIYRGVASLKFSSASLETVYDDLRLSEVEPTTQRAPIVPQTEIRLEKVRYAYPGRAEHPVFEALDLVIAAQTSVGIVGKSGAGKSTLMDVLLGLLTPDFGSLLVDGVPIVGANVANWQHAIGYVPQHIYLADTTVTQNIAFGVDHESIDMQAVQRAARIAQIHEVIVNELPDGYETPVGDRGIRLSGGQRQRLGIARALYRDPPVLFFDEATSALDSQTEDAVNEAIRVLSGTKTIVVIAHKQSSLRYCTQLIDLQEMASVASSRRGKLCSSA